MSFLACFLLLQELPYMYGKVLRLNWRVHNGMNYVYCKNHTNRTSDIQMPRFSTGAESVLSGREP